MLYLEIDIQFWGLKDICPCYVPIPKHDMAKKNYFSIRNDEPIIF